jgi:hypothetical protein
MTRGIEDTETGMLFQSKTPLLKIMAGVAGVPDRSGAGAAERVKET